MRLSLVYLAVFAAPSLVHGRRHRCSRSTPLSSVAATPDTSSGWTSTPSASVSPSSVIIASSSTPILSDSSAVSPSASASTPSSSVPTTFSTGTTPAGTPSSTDVSATPSSTDISATPSSTDVSATPSSTDVSATPSSSLSSPSLGVSSSASETPIASTTPGESTTLSTQTTPSASPVSSDSTTPVSSTVLSSSSSSSAPAATPTGWQLQSSGANSGFAGSYLLGNKPNHNAPYFFSPEVTVPANFEKLNFYIEPGTGHLFWVTDGVNNRYQFFTSYDEFEENGEYYYNVNPGYVSCYDMAVGVGSIHTQPLVCSRTGASFSCSANTPGGVFSHFMIRSSQTSSYMISFGSSVPSGWQEVTFAAADVY